MSTVASSFEKKDDMYVETKAYRELKTIVEDQNWATLLGKAGDGKSATAAHLMLHYKPQGYLPIFLSSIHQWQMLISSKPSIKQFVMIDDMFGSIYIENRKAEGWLSLMKDMEKIVKERNGDLLVVCTSRRHIFTDVKSKLYNCSLFTRTSIVDMTNEDYQLSDQEKLDVFHKFTTRYNIKVEEKLFKSVSAVNPPHGFPHCAEMFCTNAFMRERSLDFFKNPKETVQKELHNFKDNDPVKFLVLLLVLYKKHIHLSFFGEIIEHGDEQVVQLFKLLGIQQSMAYASMIQAVNALTNTYLTKTADGYYSFSHESLKENVSEVFISLNPSHAIKVLEFEQILTQLNKSRVEVKPSSHCGLTQRGIGATTSKMVAEWKACDSK